MTTTRANCVRSPSSDRCGLAMTKPQPATLFAAVPLRTLVIY
jgi:hypothetical protein